MTDLDELKAFVEAAPDPSCAHMDWPGAVLDLIERLEKAESDLSKSGTKLKAEWAMLAEAETRISELEGDAAKWRSLMASERIRIMGRTTDLNHIGVEFWRRHSAKHPSEEFPQDGCREWLNEYASRALGGET